MIQRKVCLVGDFSVGKTSLFNRFVYNRFAESYLSTVGVRLQRKVVVVGGQELALIMWDTEGGKDVSALKPSYLSGAAGAVIVCDLTRIATILHCADYAALIRQHNPHTKLTMTGNKRDLLTDDHAHVAVARQVAQELGARLTLTSASTGVGVEALFQAFGEDLIRVEPS